MLDEAGLEPRTRFALQVTGSMVLACTGRLCCLRPSGLISLARFVFVYLPISLPGRGSRCGTIGVFVI